MSVKRIGKILPLIDSIAWLVIIFWSAHYLFGEKSYYPVVTICMIVVISLLIGWFFIKDFISGVIFRMQNDFDTGDLLQFADYAGSIESFHLTHLTMQTREGRNVKIPYSKLSSDIISQRSESRIFEESKYILKLPAQGNYSDIENRIYHLLLTSPWRIINKKPKVNFLGEEEGKYHYELNVQTRNQEHFNHLMKVLESKLR